MDDRIVAELAGLNKVLGQHKDLVLMQTLFGLLWTLIGVGAIIWFLTR